jgi:hypothetical protein
MKQYHATAGTSLPEEEHLVVQNNITEIKLYF